MSAYVRQLEDDENNKIYPVTRSKAVYMPNGKNTVDEAIADLMDGDTDISFEGGNISTRLASGNVITTTFPEGTIVETCKDSEEILLWTRTTSFGEDGTIHVRIVYPEG